MVIVSSIVEFLGRLRGGSASSAPVAKPAEKKMKSSINVKVIDISHHNTIDPDGFAKMRAFGIRGVIHKASQGVGYVDPQYAVRRKAAKAAGLLWGAYHFGDNRAVASQVDWFLKSASPDDDTLVALDFEPNTDKTMSLGQCRGFLRLIESKLGRKAVLYSGNLIKETLHDGPDEYLGSHRLWLAQYGPVARVPHAWAYEGPWLWQFSGDGVNDRGIKVPGIHGQIDMNSFFGSDDDLAKQWAGAALTA
jgi:lysozyme